MAPPTDDDARLGEQHQEHWAGADLHRELLPDDHPLRDEIPPLEEHPHRDRIALRRAERDRDPRRRRFTGQRATAAATTRRGSPLATWVPGIPNYTPGRAGHTMAFDPRYVVLHTMVACEPSARARFVQPGQQASSTYFVKLDGTIGQYVSEMDAPWTNSTMYDEPGANLDSITIEHEDCGDYDGPRTPALYGASARLVRDICSFWGIPIESAHIIRHRQCAHAATACPDSLDVERIIAMASGAAPIPNLEDDMTPDEHNTLMNCASVLAKLDSRVLGDIGNDNVGLGMTISAIRAIGEKVGLEESELAQLLTRPTATVDVDALAAALAPHIAGGLDAQEVAKQVAADLAARLKE